MLQCDRRNRLLLNFSGVLTVLKIETFLRLKKAVDQVDVAQMASSTSRSADVEIITVCGCDSCFVLTLPELVALKELLAGARFMLELNSMLQQCLHAEVA